MITNNNFNTQACAYLSLAKKEWKAYTSTREKLLHIQ